MKRILILNLILISVVMLQAKAQANDHLRSYPQEAYRQALDDAQLEGKLVLLDFTAQWCTPCRWMKNTTFKDPKLTQYLSERYIVVNIDIDDFEGYSLKEKYNVKLLPTFIILDSRGQQLLKMEESMGPSKMYRICKSYDKAEHLSNTTQPSKPIPEKHIFQTTQPRSSEDHLKEKSKPSSESNTDPIEHHYQLQLGVFNSFDNASNLADRVSNDFDASVEIKNIGGRFKVLLGYFETRAEAEQKREELLSRSFEAVILKIP